MFKAKILLSEEEEMLIISSKEVAIVDYDKLRKAFKKVKEFLTEEQWEELKKSHQFNVRKNKLIIPEEIKQKNILKNF